MDTSDDNLLIEAKKRMKNHDFFGAQKRFQTFIDRNPNSIEGWYLFGLLKEAMGNNPPGIMARQDLFLDAIQKFQSVVQLEPNHPEANLHIAFCYRNLAKWARNESEKIDPLQKSIPFYQRSIQQKADCYAAWFSLGLVYLELKLKDLAIEGLIHATKCKDVQKDAWRILGEIYESQKDWVNALDAFNQVLLFSKDTKEQKNVKESITRMQILLQSNKDYVEYDQNAVDNMIIGQRLTAEANYPKAIQFLTASLMLFKKSQNESGITQAQLHLTTAEQLWNQFVEATKK